MLIYVDGVFNLAAGALNVRDNGKNVSFESYCLAITELAILVLTIVITVFGGTAAIMASINKKIREAEASGVEMTKEMVFIKKNPIVIMIITVLSFLVAIAPIATNIGYSSLVIEYYNNQKMIDSTLYNYSIAIMALNSLGIIKAVVKYIRR